MRTFRILLAAIFCCISAYTTVVVVNHGFGLFEVFFGDIRNVQWPGQFNLDFLSLLTLSALWLAWRHHFSAMGCAFALLGFFGGGLFLSAYLFVETFRAGGDMRRVLLGNVRADASDSERAGRSVS